MNSNFRKFAKPLVIAVALLVVPVFVFAQQIVGFEAALTGGTYHVGTDSTNGVVSTVVASDNIQVTLDPGQFVRLNSTGRKEVTLSDTSGLTISTDCNTDEYIVRIEVPSTGSQRTFTITPSSTTCTSGGGGGGTSTGGGGGGGGGPIRLPAATYVPPQAQAPEVVPVTVPAPSAGASAIFNSDLSFGTKGDDVTRLQQLLASDPSIYPEGLVTGYFGNLTVKAVRAFQAKYGISQVGRVGPQTRARLAEIFAAGQTPSAVPTPATPVAAGLTRELDPGAKGDDVTALQEFLAKDKSIYPEGLVTGYFGSLTAKAVRAFQAKYGISQVGRVGPATLKKLQELMGAAPAPVQEPVLTPAPSVPAPVTTPAPAQSSLTPDPETQKPFNPRTYGQ